MERSAAFNNTMINKNIPAYTYHSYSGSSVKGSNSRKQIRVKSKSRFIFFMTILIILGVLGFNSLFGMNTVSGESSHRFVTVQIVSGETLWDVATEYMPADMDKREAIYQIQKANDLSDSSVKPGQILKVPVQ